MAVDMAAEGNRESELTHALAAVRSRLALAAEAVGRNVSEIELLPITKFFPATDVAILSRLGCRSVGESREQEASAKVAELARLEQASPRTDWREVHWHMVGQIQRKKARSLARWAHTAHSIDSAQLVTALDRAVAAALATGWLSQRGWDRSVMWLFVAMGIGHILILGAGFAWLAFGMKLGVDKAWLVGVMPFIAASLVKNALGATLVPAIRRLLAPRA